MFIAINIVLAAIVLTGIVTLLARNIKLSTENEYRTVEAPVSPKRHVARSHARRQVTNRPAGAHF